MARLTLSILGTTEIALDDQPITHFRSVTMQGILLYLALQSGRQISRDVLATLFWPEDSEQNARNNLRQALYQLRKLLGDTQNPQTPFLTVTRTAVQFNPGADWVSDVGRFLAAIDGDDLAAAADLYQGDLLPGFTLDSLEFEEWLRMEREQLHHLALEAMTDLAREKLAAGRLDEVQSLARRQIAHEPWRETAHRQLIRGLALAGDRPNALAQYERCRAILEEELGLEPEAVTTKLYEDIKAGRFGRQQAEDSVKPSLLINNNLPADTTPLIGRDDDLEQIRGFFTVDGRRLVTIAGPGGMGKTRLALACLDQHLTADSPFPDGIFFIDLAPLSGTNQIPSALADALNFSLQGGDARSPQQQIIDYLRDKKMLLLFDNFEHLLDGVEMVVDLLESARDLKVLVTSRERLNVRLEQLYPIEGLQFPDLGTLDDVETYTAVRMFLQSARRNQPDFALRDGDDLTYLAHICQLVAGMPLALEIAASWVDMLPLAEIAAELQHGLDFLETDMRDLPERQRSVRAAIDYSWQHLTEEEQEIFAKLSVFRGGFTREAARAVAEANLRQMGRLVDKSFLQYDQIHDRYRVHELMRQYGAEKLADAESVQTQHLIFFVAFAENVEAGFGGPEPDSWANRLRADMDNCRAALDWAAESDQAQAGLRMAAALHNYWTAFSDWREARQRLAQLLALPSAAQRTVARAYTLHEAGNLACHMGDYEAGFSLLEESREIGLELGEAGKVCVGFTLVTIAEHLLPQGNKAAARKALDEGIAILREAGEPWQLWLGFTIRGVVALQSGDYPQAETFFNEALAFTRRIGYRWFSGISMSTLGYLLYLQGDFSTARSYLEESEIVLRPLNDLKHRSLSSLGAIALLQGSHQQAVTYFEEHLTNSRLQGNKVNARAMSDLGIATGHLSDHTRSAALLSEALTLAREATNLYDKAVCLLGVASIQPRPRKAVQLLAAAQAAFEASGAIMVEPLYNAESERIEMATRAVLGETAFTAAYAAGNALAAEKAIAMALIDSHEWADGSFSSLDWS